MMAGHQDATGTHLRAVGLMSGTSMDAIDAAVVEVSGSGAALRVHLVAFHSLPWPPSLRRRALQACTPGDSSTRLICELNAEVGEVFARAALAAIRAAGLAVDDVDLIGSHGQTVWHQGTEANGNVASTLQLGEPSIIAERTGITTVADFRPRDMAAGGQGAPLVSYLDWALYRSEHAGRALQNIGGIANVTVLPPACRLEDVFAFDTGPGNMLLDALASLSSNGTLTYDRDGELARAGRADPALLGRILAHPFFALPPPRTAGREQFGSAYAQAIWQEGQASSLTAADILATATLATARSIAGAYRRWVLPRTALEGVFLSGGGARNPALLDALWRELPEVPLQPLTDLGGDAQAKEAVAFAVLAVETLRNVPTSVPGATGARHAAVLGKIVPGANWRHLHQRLTTEDAAAQRLRLPAAFRPGQVTIGIDGGGTTTTAVAMDGAGAILARATAGPANVKAAGWTTAAGSLQTVLQALAAALPPDAVIVGVHAALAGAGRAEDALPVQHFLLGLCRTTELGRLAPRLERDHIRVSNDAVAVLAAAELRCGIVVIAGTGSLVWGQNAAGDTARAGGWGYLLGDEGSGYDLGRRALMAVLAEYDRQEPPSALATALLSRLGVAAPPELVGRIYDETSARTDIAALAPEVLRFLDAGDATAQRLVQRSVHDLAGQVRLVAARLHLGATPTSVVCSGGLFQNDTFFRALQEALRDDEALSCRRPARTAAEGAALLAWADRSLAEAQPSGA